jgi:hypothetical protein
MTLKHVLTRSVIGMYGNIRDFFERGIWMCLNINKRRVILIFEIDVPIKIPWSRVFSEESDILIASQDVVYLPKLRLNSASRHIYTGAYRKFSGLQSK